MENLNEEKLLQELNAAKAGADSACTDCLQNAQNAYISCTAAAKTPAEKSACLASLNSALANCHAGPCRKP